MSNKKQPSDSKANLLYLQEMLGELRNVAESEGADMLCYLIEMAYIETGDILANDRPLKMGIKNGGNPSSRVTL